MARPGAEKIAALSEKRGRYEAMLAQLDRTGEDQISLTDPDSRRHGRALYEGRRRLRSIQVAVDAKNKLIVEQAVTNQVVDTGLLDTDRRAAPAKSWASRRSTSSPIAATSKSRISRLARRPAAFPTLPSTQRGSSVREGLFQKDEFRYDAGLNAYVLPGREVADADPAAAGCAISQGPITATGESLPRLSSARAMHERRPLSFPPRKRGRSRSHGRAPQSEAGGFSTAAARSSSIPLGSIKQWDVSELPSRCAWPRQRARRVQPDRARLMVRRALEQHPRRRGHDGRGSRLRHGYAALSARTGVLGALGRVRRSTRPKRSDSLTARSSRCFTPNSGSFARSARVMLVEKDRAANVAYWHKRIGMLA